MLPAPCLLPAGSNGNNLFSERSRLSQALNSQDSPISSFYQLRNSVLCGKTTKSFGFKCTNSNKLFPRFHP